jgi:hypothetical protein
MTKHDYMPRTSQQKELAENSPSYHTFSSVAVTFSHLGTRKVGTHWHWANESFQTHDHINTLQHSSLLENFEFSIINLNITLTTLAQMKFISRKYKLFFGTPHLFQSL